VDGARQWFLRPLLAKEVLEARLDAVEFFTTPRAAIVMAELKTAMRHVRDMNRALTRFAKATTSINDWLFVLEVRTLCLENGGKSLRIKGGDT
jgi:DNA mismatch repair ATPase MutS